MVFMQRVAVLLRLESSAAKYCELDLSKSIKENLVQKTIIEFPTFVVILSEYKHLFDVIKRERKQ